MSGPARRFVEWAFGLAVPFWTEAGWDPVDGGFVEILSPDGRPDPAASRRMRVQARQVAVLALTNQVTPSAVLLDRARRGWDQLVHRAWMRGEGGFAHLLAADGRVLDARRDLYDQAFALFAAASLARAEGSRGPLIVARRLQEFLDTHMAEKAGGYAEAFGGDDRVRLLPRRQNPHMHLLEAYLALHEADPEAGWDERARAMVSLFRRRFLDRSGATVIEFFEEDWSPATGRQGTLREPGHAFEWVWLLNRHAALTGDEGAKLDARLLFETAIRHGIDREPGSAAAVPDECDDRHLVLRATRRLWPQTECIKAAVATFEASNDQLALALAEERLEALFEQHLAPGSPVWTDQIDRDGTPRTGPIPASTLYHLVVAAAEVRRVLLD